MKAMHIRNPHLQFALPVIIDTLLSTFINLIYSSLIGGISGSSLTVISQGNMIITVIVASMSMLTTGSAVLCSRLRGAGEYREASHIVEQSLLLSIVFSLTITMLCFAFTVPLITLLMPNAEPAVLAEGFAYFRVLILSLPFLVLSSTLVSVQRASGDSRTSMVINVCTGLMQLLFAFLFLRVFKAGVTGAGFTFLLCRAGGVVLAFYVVIRSQRYFLNIKRLPKPDYSAFRRIFRIGVPASVESVFVQVGYLIAGSMVIGLGTFEAAVYNVANTLYSFAALPQGIFSAVALATTGQLLGAQEYQKAKRNGWRLLAMAIAASLCMSFLLFILRHQLTPLYSADPAVQAASAAAIAAALLMNIPGVSLNALTPQLQAGGAVKTVMLITITGVWAVRLPLTWLLCYHFTLGAQGLFLANAIALYVRLVFTLIAFIRGRYLYMRV